MHERASSYRSKSVDGIAKKGMSRLAVGTLVVMAHAMASCYSPNYSAAIYRCDTYSCPNGLVCNSDQLCVTYPAAGCTNGGIAIDNEGYLCPGIRNSCQKGYSACATPSMGLACGDLNTDLGVGQITGENVVCAICCPM